MTSSGLLKKGDRVAIILPASHLSDKSLELGIFDQAVCMLKEWGLVVDQLPDLRKKYFYLAGDDNYRSNQLRSALTNPDIRAIFCARGGYGSARIINKVLYNTLNKDKLLIGFSDITTLHLSLCKYLTSVHAPNLVSNQLIGNESYTKKNRNNLYKYLFMGDLPIFDLYPINLAANRTISLNGKVGGGNLTLVTGSLGTDYQISKEHSVLLLEEVAESPYKMDRMLTQLKNAKIFNSVKAIVFGDMKNCNSKKILIDDILADLFLNDTLPVFKCSSFGHGDSNAPWKYGGDVNIDKKGVKYQLKFS